MLLQLSLSLITFKFALSAISWDPACGSSKGCFPDCTGGCHYLVKWQDFGSNIHFTLQAEETDTNVYIAIGFSNDYRMGDDSVVGCMIPGTTVYSYYNEDTNTNELSHKTLGLTATNLTQTGGVITCSFNRSFTQPDSKFFDLHNDYILMLVVGEVKNKHGQTKLSKHYMIPWSSEGKVDFNRYYVVPEHKLNTPLVKLHGIMMVMAWQLMVTVGIVIARYNKDMLPDRKLFGTKVWFQLHRGVMVGALACVVVGFITIFVHLDGYSQVPPRNSVSGGDAHPILGIIVTVFCFANPVMAVFRPDPNHKYRWIFNWAHFGVGIVGQILAVVNLIIGYLLERANLPRSVIWVIVAHLIVIVVVCGALEGSKCFYTHVRKRTLTNSSQNIPIDDKKVTGVRENEPNLPLIALVMTTITSFAFSVSVLALIATS